MSDKLYTAAEMREAYVDGVNRGIRRCGRLWQERMEGESQAEALLFWPDPPPDKEEKR